MEKCKHAKIHIFHANQAALKVFARYLKPLVAKKLNNDKLDATTKKH